MKIQSINEDRHANVIGYTLETSKIVELQTPVKREDLEADKFAALLDEKQLEIPGLPKPKAKADGAPELFPEKQPPVVEAP